MLREQSILQLENNRMLNNQGLSPEDEAVLRRSVAEKDQIIKNQEEKIANLGKVVSDLQGVLAAANSDNKATSLIIEEEVAKLKQEIAEATRETRIVKEELEATRKDRDGANEQITALERELGDTKEELERAHDSLKKTTATSSTTIKSLQEELERLHHANGKGAGQMAEMEERWRKALEEEVSRLTSSHKKAMKKIDDENSALKTDVARAQEQNVALAKQKDVLEEKMSKLKRANDSDIFGLKKKIQELEKQLETEKEEHETEKIDLETIIEELRGELDKLKNREPVPSGSKFKMYVDLKKDNRKLEKQLEKTQKDIRSGNVASGRQLLNKKRTDAKKGHGFSGLENKNQNDARVERSGSADCAKRSGGGAPPSEVMW